MRSLSISARAREFLGAQALTTVEHLLDVLIALRDDPDVDGVTKTYLLMLPVVQRLWGDGSHWIRYTYERDKERVVIHEIGVGPLD